jgi:hypothetical protein
MDSDVSLRQNPAACWTRMEDPHVRAGEVVIRKTPGHGTIRRGRFIKSRPEQFCCTAQLNLPLLTRDPEIKPQYASGFPCRPCKLQFVKLFFRPAPIFDVAPVPHPFSFLAPAVLHAHLATCTHLHFPLPHPFMHSLTTIGFLSQISSLSAPGPTGPTGPLTAVTSPSGQAISPRFGWAHRTIPAVRVSPLPCFRPRIDGHRPYAAH